MNKIIAVRIFGGLIITAVVYICFSAAVLMVSFLLLQTGRPVAIPWIFSVQRELYTGGAWHVWQAQSQCVDFDPRVIYKPKLGECQFVNLEFNTVLTFDNDGRRMGDMTTGADSVAVIGDSFAMGWGVGDTETFAFELQRLIGRKVYNLGVSSYGTVRELMRLEDSGIYRNVDTVIIQYCDNDLEENLNFRVPTPEVAQQTFLKITAPASGDKLSFLKYMYRGFRFSILHPMFQLRRAVSRRPGLEDFGPHYRPLMNAIRKSDALRDKKVVVIYNNSWGARYRNFPAGQDNEMKNVRFVDLSLDPADHYLLDSHLNKGGHRKVAQQLAAALESL